MSLYMNGSSIRPWISNTGILPGSIGLDHADVGLVDHAGRQGEARQRERTASLLDLVGQRIGRTEVRGERVILPGDRDRADPEGVV